MSLNWLRQLFSDKGFFSTLITNLKVDKTQFIADGISAVKDSLSVSPSHSLFYTLNLHKSILVLFFIYHYISITLSLSLLLIYCFLSWCLSLFLLVSLDLHKSTNIYLYLSISLSLQPSIYSLSLAHSIFPPVSFFFIPSLSISSARIFDISAYSSYNIFSSRLFMLSIAENCVNSCQAVGRHYFS